MRLPTALALVALLGACASSGKFRPSGAAPSLPPSASVAVASEPPQNAQLLGVVTVRGNNSQSVAGCESQAVLEAKKVGATHVVVRPKKSPWYRSRQPECEAAAYYVAPK